MTTIQKVTNDFRRTLWVLAAFSLLTNLLVLAQPLYMLQVYDRVLPSHSTSTLLFLSLAMALSLMVLGLMEIVRSVIANRAAARFDIGLSDLALRTIIAGSREGGASAQPLRDIASLRGLIASKVLFGLLDLPFSTIFIAIMYLIHPALFWLTLAGAAVLVIVAVLNQWALTRATKQQGDLATAAAQKAEHLARNAESLLAMGMVTNAVNGWGHIHAGSLTAADKAAQLNAWFAGLSRMLRVGLQVAILGYGALLVLEGQMTAGMIFAASLISGRALQPVDQIIGSWRQLAAGLEAWRRTQAFMEKADRRERYTSLPAPRGLLEVQDLLQVNPADAARPPILARISFRLEPGESVAVLGPSGSGKSTLARMIVGAATPRAGHVRIDGHDIRNRDPEELGRHIGYLAQDVELVPGTVAQNIARFEPQPDGAAIVAAARAAHVEDLVARLPHGYDTPVGPGGVQLSGGEKQRIALARALYGDPRILVLDEPNSSLDRAGEIALMRALSDARKRGVTVFIITQREMVLAGVDKIMRMQNGQILEFDRSDIVIERHGGRRPAGAGETRNQAEAAEPQP
ncbi:MAG: type I secretion system permease/ATPase [Nitratireductor sp.]|nr:type I secretion system permease/ATPase [Nitratireductor sp.]